ncbi:hypothetical protein TNCV_300071 [Trichonephila clavipes]|nr:hypothetical protein TNCV_300071 [Trichonephila clavipes]
MKLVEREGTGCLNSSLSPPPPSLMRPALGNTVAAPGRGLACPLSSACPDISAVTQLSRLQHHEVRALSQDGFNQPLYTMDSSMAPRCELVTHHPQVRKHDHSAFVI